MKKILSISIAAYNAEKDIENCLNSFINTKVIDDLEIIVVNDGSSDNTSNIVKKYQEKYNDSIVLVDKENGGHGSTINTSIKKATGKYFKTVDSDDWVDIDGLEKLVDYLKRNDVDLLLNPYVTVNVDGKITGECNCIKPNSKIAYNKVLDFDVISEDINLAMASMTFKTDIVKKMGPIIDEKCFYVDVEYTVYPIKYVRSVVCFEYPVYNYLLGTVTQSMNLKNLQKRNDQHLRVCESLLRFYNSEKEMSDSKRNLIRNRISTMLIMQYYIYITMDCKDSLLLIKKFDIWLREQSLELYNYVITFYKRKLSRHMLLIKIFRKVNYHGYNFVIKFLNLIKVIKR